METFYTDFEGLILISYKVYKDSRGLFYESWKEDTYQEIGLNEKFLQDNVSISKKNVLRGLHFQRNQGQLVYVTYGKVFDVAVDIRPESRTYKKYFSIELDASKPYQLYMPPGFAHGFYVLSDMAIVNYKCTQYYDPHHEGGIIWNDRDINIKWPDNKFVISDRDRAFSSLKEVIL